MKRIALFALSILLVLAGCEKKPAGVVTESVWAGTLEVQGIPLANTLTVYSDQSFALDTTATFFGVGMNFNRVGLGTVQGDSKAEGEIVFTLEELAQDIAPVLKSAGAAELLLPLAISASIQGNQLILSDIGLGQEVRLTRQEVKE